MNVTPIRSLHSYLRERNFLPTDHGPRYDAVPTPTLIDPNQLTETANEKQSNGEGSEVDVLG